MALTSRHAREAQSGDDMLNERGIDARALPTKPVEERMTTEDINRAWKTTGGVINLCNGVGMKQWRRLAARDRQTPRDIRVGVAQG
jgi:hypothetical protein